jgi:hypothetical protein
VGLFLHTMVSVIFRLVWIIKLRDCCTLDAIAFLQKYDAAIIFSGAVWNVIGLCGAFALLSAEAGAFRHAIVLNGLATLVTYPVEIYFFYCGVIRFRGAMDRIVSISRTPKSSALQQGSLNCCAVVDFDELGAERVQVRACAICLDEIHPSGKVRKTPCGHFFHESCLQGWFRQGACCPLCRMDCSTPTALQNAFASDTESM